MSTLQKPENRPADPPPSDRPKTEKRDVVVGQADGRVFEIPLNVASQYEVEADHNNEDEVGGRHRTWLNNGTFGYHNDWLYGTYLWITDGRWYTGYHWHPNPYNPAAYDRDNY